MDRIPLQNYISLSVLLTTISLSILSSNALKYSSRASHRNDSRQTKCSNTSVSLFCATHFNSKMSESNIMAKITRRLCLVGLHFYQGRTMTWILQKAVLSQIPRACMSALGLHWTCNRHNFTNYIIESIDKIGPIVYFFATIWLLRTVARLTSSIAWLYYLLLCERADDLFVCEDFSGAHPDFISIRLIEYRKQVTRG